MRVLTHELRRFAIAESKHVMEDEHLTVALRSGADADRRHRYRLGDRRSKDVGNAFEHERENAGRGERARVVEQLTCGFGELALHAEAAHDVDGLRREADVAQ